MSMGSELMQAMQLVSGKTAKERWGVFMAFVFNFVFFGAATSEWLIL